MFQYQGACYIARARYELEALKRQILDQLRERYTPELEARLLEVETELSLQERKRRENSPSV